MTFYKSHLSLAPLFLLSPKKVCQANFFRAPDYFFCGANFFRGLDYFFVSKLFPGAPFFFACSDVFHVKHIFYNQVIKTISVDDRPYGVRRYILVIA